MSKIGFALFFADGRAFYFGVALVAFALLLGNRPKLKLVRLTQIPLLEAGVLLIALSSTPASLWFYAVWAAVTLGWYGLRRRAKAPPWQLRTAQIVALALCFAAVVLETRFAFSPQLHVPAGTRVVILGDSLSAGLAQADRTWPEVLTETSPYEIVDLSRAGATVDSALPAAQKMPSGPGVIIIELGGNDLLGGTSDEQFEAGLERLFHALQAPGRQCLMFELPLPPLAHEFGRIQRRLAARYDAKLIPKRVLSRVLGGPEGTQDGLHFSDAGHRAVAENVMGILAVKK